MYNDFTIHLEALKIGEHSFKYLLDNSFFESLDYSLITGGKLDVKLILVKRENYYDLAFHYDGFTDSVCDRCGDDFELALNFKFETLLKHGKETLEDEGIWVIDKSCVELEVKHYLYETLCLYLPSRITHSTEEECNQELLNKLIELSSGTENENKVDPRWDALNKLNKN